MIRVGRRAVSNFDVSMYLGQIVVNAYEIFITGLAIALGVAIGDFLINLSEGRACRSERHSSEYSSVLISSGFTTLFWLSSGRKPYTLLHATPRHITIAYFIQVHKDLIWALRALCRASEEVTVVVSHYP